MNKILSKYVYVGVAYKSEYGNGILFLFYLVTISQNSGTYGFNSMGKPAKSHTALKYVTPFVGWAQHCTETPSKNIQNIP